VYFNIYINSMIKTRQLHSFYAGKKILASGRVCVIQIRKPYLI
jgi:hypothetical protein